MRSLYFRRNLLRWFVGFCRKVRESKVDASAEYHVNAASAGSVKRKLGAARGTEAPMEERLENLSIGQARSQEKDSTPRAHKLSHLLAQVTAPEPTGPLNTCRASLEPIPPSGRKCCCGSPPIGDGVYTVHT